MEIANFVLKAISTVGFPAVMCGALMWYISTTQTKTQEVIIDLTSAISELKVALKKED